MSLRNQTIVGVFWNFLEQFARRGVQLATTLLLAYFLTPGDFGLVAMMTVFIAIATVLMESGFKQALIRLKNATQEDYNTAFYANLALGLAAYAVLYLTAPYIAAFYDEQELVTLLRVAGVVVILNAFQVIQVVILSREMQFRLLLKASVPAALLSAAVAVSLGYLGAGVWALVAQIISSAFFLTAFLWLLGLWRPQLVFSKTALREMYGFGYKLFLSGLLDTVFKNIYILVVGKLFAATVAGHYFFASKLREILVTQLTAAIQNVTYPALSKIQDDNHRLKAGYRKVVTFAAFIIFPILVLSAILTTPFFELFLNESWQPAVPYFQILCLSGLLYPLHSINLNILKVKGRSDLFLYVEVIKKSAAILILLVSINFGIYGILVGQLVSSILSYIPNIYFSSKVLGYSFKEQMSDVLPTFLIVIFVGSTYRSIIQVIELNSWLSLFLGPIFFIIFYLVLSYAFNFEGTRILWQYFLRASKTNSN